MTIERCDGGCGGGDDGSRLHLEPFFVAAGC